MSFDIKDEYLAMSRALNDIRMAVRLIDAYEVELSAAPTGPFADKRRELIAGYWALIGELSSSFTAGTPDPEFWQRNERGYLQFHGKESKEVCL